MEAGPDIDSLVAEAIGLDVWVTDMFSEAGNQCYRKGPKHPVPGKKWSPSTNWNDAMYAAEKVGLFGEPYVAYLIMESSGNWKVDLSDDAGLIEREFYSHTGPFAICKAILSLKGLTMVNVKKLDTTIAELSRRIDALEKKGDGALNDDTRSQDALEANGRRTAESREGD